MQSDCLFLRSSSLSVAGELGGGVLLIAGYRVRFVAIALAVFSLATAVSFHNDFADRNQMIHFLKNLMITGGLPQIAAFGAGALSLDTAKGWSTMKLGRIEL